MSSVSEKLIDGGRAILIYTWRGEMRVGLVGWRGMVGSVLMQRMVEEKDFDLIEPVYYSISNRYPCPVLGGKEAGLLQDAFDIDSLKQLDAVITCQKSDYTSKVFYPALRQAGWKKVTGLMQLLR
ncbi:hypothetical protein O9992_03350 [Vibrio lentus]|nr:hypothetical protein [Vibrio lentus]